MSSKKKLVVLGIRDQMHKIPFIPCIVNCYTKLPYVYHYSHILNFGLKSEIAAIAGQWEYIESIL